MTDATLSATVSTVGYWAKKGGWLNNRLFIRTLACWRRWLEWEETIVGGWYEAGTVYCHRGRVTTSQGTTVCRRLHVDSTQTAPKTGLVWRGVCRCPGRWLQAQRDAVQAWTSIVYQQLYADQQHDFRALSIPLQMNWPSVPLDYRPRSSHTGFSARQLNITIHEYSKATSCDAFLQLIHRKFNIAYDNTVIQYTGQLLLQKAKLQL